MIGPITNEIAKANRKRIEEAFQAKVREIELLYLKPGIPVPKNVQLSHPKEVCEAYELMDVSPPELAKKKFRLLERIELLGGLAFIFLLFGIIFTLVKKWDDFPVAFLVIIIFLPLILFAIIFTSISKTLQRNFDSKN